MNTLLDQCLTLLLGWLQLPVRAFWQLFSSSGQNTGTGSTVLAGFLVFLLVVGFILDIAAGKIRKRQAAPENQPAAVPPEEIPAPEDPAPRETEDPRAAYRRPETIPAKQVPLQTPEMDRPIFDELPLRWDSSVSPAQPPLPADPAPVQVHPGLNDDALQDHLNMPEEEPGRKDWHPFENAQYTPPPTGLSRLARKAKKLISLQDSETEGGLKDYRPSINHTDAYHAPVYPKQNHTGEP